MLSRLLINHVGVQHAFLLQIVRHGVLRQKGSLQPNLGADPFAFAVRRVQRVVATAAAAELRAEIGAPAEPWSAYARAYEWSPAIQRLTA